MLEIIFCTYPELDALLAEQTRLIAENTHIRAVTDGISYKPAGLQALLQKRGAGGGLVAAVNGWEAAMKLRAAFRDSYLIYFSETYDDLILLTNNNVRLSGYVKTDAQNNRLAGQYTDILSLICDDYARKRVNADEQFTVVIGKQLRTFRLDDIIYFESINKKVNITTVSLSLSYYESLTNIENRLKKQFIRCHNSFLINVKHIREISFKEMEIKLSHKISVPISQRHKPDVQQLLNIHKAAPLP